MAEGRLHRKRTVVGGLFLASAVVAAFVLVLYPGLRKPGVPGAPSVGGEKDVILPDPPGPVLLRWKFPAGQTLAYALTGKETDRLDEGSWVTTLSGTLTLRGLGNGEGEGELVLVRVRGGASSRPAAASATSHEEARASADAQAQAPTGPQHEAGPGASPPAQPGALPAGALRQNFTLDSRGRPVGAEARAELLLTIFGIDFPLAEEGLRRGASVGSTTGPPPGLPGARPNRLGAGLVTRQQRWTKTVQRVRYPCLRVEGTSYQDASIPSGTAQRILTTRTATSLCYFAYEQGFLVEWAVDRAEEITCSREAGAGTRPQTLYRSQQLSLRLTEVREEGGDQVNR